VSQSAKSELFRPFTSWLFPFQFDFLPFFCTSFALFTIAIRSAHFVNSWLTCIIDTDKIVNNGGSKTRDVKKIRGMSGGGKTKTFDQNLFYTEILWNSPQWKLRSRYLLKICIFYSMKQAKWRWEWQVMLLKVRRSPWFVNILIYARCAVRLRTEFTYETLDTSVHSETKIRRPKHRWGALSHMVRRALWP